MKAKSTRLVVMLVTAYAVTFITGFILGVVAQGRQPCVVIPPAKISALELRAEKLLFEGMKK